MGSPACVRALSFRYSEQRNFIKEYQSHRTLFVAILKKNLRNLEIRIDGLVEKRRDDFAVLRQNLAVNELALQSGCHTASRGITCTANRTAAPRRGKMSQSETCAHGNVAPLETLQQLHDSQAGIGRHKCTNCAYDKGFTAGVSGVANSEPSDRCIAGSAAPISVLRVLPESQAGSGRHKCTNCAYQNGYEDGLLAQHSELKKNELPDIGANSFPDVDYENLAIKEGSRQWVQHFSRERRPEIVTAKKAQTLKTRGSLKCEVVNLTFKIAMVQSARDSAKFTIKYHCHLLMKKQRRNWKTWLFSVPIATE